MPSTKRPKPLPVKPSSSLAAWRDERGFAQREAAAYLGITQGYYSKLELGIQTPRPKIAKQLRELTGVPLDVLMGIAS